MFPQVTPRLSDVAPAVTGYRDSDHSENKCVDCPLSSVFAHTLAAAVNSSKAKAALVAVKALKAEAASVGNKASKAEAALTSANASKVAAETAAAVAESACVAAIQRAYLRIDTERL